MYMILNQNGWPHPLQAQNWESQLYNLGHKKTQEQSKDNLHFRLIYLFKAVNVVLFLVSCLLGN